MLSRASSDPDDQSEPDIGDVTLPPSLQLVTNMKPMDINHRITSLRVNGSQDACDTILEDEENCDTNKQSEAVASNKHNNNPEEPKLHEAEQSFPRRRDESLESHSGIGLPESPSPTPAAVLRPPEPLSPRDNNKAMRSPKRANGQKCLSLLRNPLALSGEENADDDQLAEEPLGHRTLSPRKPALNTAVMDRLATDKISTPSDMARGAKTWPLVPQRDSTVQQRPDHGQVNHDNVSSSLQNEGCSVPKATSSKLSLTHGKSSQFEETKRMLAETFLGQLDTALTEGKIAELAKSTGGVKLLWTKSLNTTAGRANWKKETVRTTAADGTETSLQHHHHASIELAEKVIDDEHRLLNVLAHEFCHLANFMISGVTNNPHGKDFKAWALKCSAAFGDRGVKVTTKHTYDIDFKYAWQCVNCASQYKRHSKSINPEKHRCGSCKGKLTQTKPKPRNSGKPSEYQLFIKEQMRALREEHPSSPQKDIMSMAAERWALRAKSAAPEVEQVADKLLSLTLEGDSQDC